MTESSRLDRFIGYYFWLTVALYLLYPISTYGAVAEIIFALIAAASFFFGVYVVADRKNVRQIASVLGATALLSSIPFNFLGLNVQSQLEGSDLLIALTYFSTYSLFTALLALVLVRYIFTVKHVTSHVLYAASTVYLLIAGAFAPFYTALEALSPGSFVAAYSDSVLTWQDFIYYSFSTLSTLGYGDLVPVGVWARSFASAEAVIGVLYLAIMMARLVGLYAADLEQAQ